MSLIQQFVSSLEVHDIIKIPERIEETVMKDAKIPMYNLDIYHQLSHNEASRYINNFNVLESYAKTLPDYAFIAGGLITKTLSGMNYETDIDIFFKTEDAFRTVLLNLLDKNKTIGTIYHDYELDKTSIKNANETWSNIRFVKFIHKKKPPIQLIKVKWYDLIKACLDSFDLTIVQFAISRDLFIYNPFSILDLARKRINVHRIVFPESTLRRVIKYAKRGFYADTEDLARICFNINRTDVGKAGKQFYQ